MYIHDKYLEDILQRKPHLQLQQRNKYLELNLIRNMKILYDDNFRSFLKDIIVGLKKWIGGPFLGYDNSTLWSCQFSLI